MIEPRCHTERRDRKKRKERFMKGVSVEGEGTEHTEEDWQGRVEWWVGGEVVQRKKWLINKFDKQMKSGSVHTEHQATDKHVTVNLTEILTKTKGLSI